MSADQDVFDWIEFVLEVKLDDWQKRVLSRVMSLQRPASPPFVASDLCGAYSLPLTERAIIASCTLPRGHAIPGSRHGAMVDGFWAAWPVTKFEWTNRPG
jgi:hypothetical protein